MIMKSNSSAALLVICACCVSCASNDALQQRMDGRNEAYGSLNERREIRADARQERTDMWYDRHMH